MGPGETLSLAAVVVMVMAVTGIVAGAYRSRLAFRQRELELRLELAKVELEMARATPDTTPLENRVRVLERIATDTATQRARDLASQIDDLAKPDPLLN